MTKFYIIQDDDDDINAAIAEAQRRLPEFRRIVEDDARRILPAYTTFVKVCLESAASGAIEHLWLEGVYFEEDEVGGSVVTPPEEMPEFQLGTQVRVSVSRISDWVYYEDEVPTGGFIEQVFKKRSKGA